MHFLANLNLLLFGSYNSYRLNCCCGISELVFCMCLQCFDTIGRTTGRAYRGAGVVI